MLFLIAFFGCLSAIVFLGVWWHLGDKRRLYRLFQEQAAKRRGRVTLFLPTLSPRLHLTVHGVDIRLRAMNRSLDFLDRGMMTCAEFPVCNPEAPQVHIREKRFAPVPIAGYYADLPWVPRKFHRFSLGVPGFDERFQLKGDQPERTRGLLSDEGLLESLLSLPFRSNIQLKRHRCVACLLGIPQTEEDLNRLIQAASEILLALIRYDD